MKRLFRLSRYGAEEIVRLGNPTGEYTVYATPKDIDIADLYKSHIIALTDVDFNKALNKARDNWKNHGVRFNENKIAFYNVIEDRPGDNYYHEWSRN